MIQSLTGMQDIVGDEAKKYNYVVNSAKEVLENYDFNFVKMPMLEKTELFIRSVGGSSDIVNKEMYRFIDKGENDVCLRPEGTAGVARYFVQNKLDRQPQKFKFYYHGSMFRYERPQKGRYREFNQFGCESFGEESVYEDYAIIEMASAILGKLDISYKLELNSLGCKECRPKYIESLKEFLRDKKDKLCEDCNRRLEQNPLRVLDCKVQSCQAEYEDAPKITDNLCESCDTDFTKLKELLDSNSINYEVNKKLVRGLDYYNKTIFEFISDKIGAQGTVIGGGRYDGLISYLDGKETPAVGFGMGVERVMLLTNLPSTQNSGYHLGAMDEEALSSIISLTKSVRISHKATLEYKPKKLKALLKGADKANAKYCVVIGENELKEGKVWLKDLVTKDESTPTIDEFLNSIK